jgi:hypothetical protein
MMRLGIATALLLLAGGALAGEPQFLVCEQALYTPQFIRLVAFYGRHPELPKPNECFRLNDREFLVTVTADARVAQGLYYFDSATQTYDLADGAYRPEVSIAREFDIARKHFVLVESSNLNAGQWNTIYEVLFLRPKGAGRPFEIQRLLELQQDPEEGMCGSRLLEGTAAKVESIDVSVRCTEANMIAFELKTQSCPGGAIETRRPTFEWNGSSFVELGTP